MIATLALLAIAQATASPASPPTRWSILTPAEACRSQAVDGKDILVCGRLPSADRLPLPDERAPPDRPRQATGDYRDNSGGGAPCSARLEGCLVGFGPPIMPLLKGAVGLVKGAFAGHSDKTGRIPIPLDDPAPPVSRIEP